MSTYINIFFLMLLLKRSISNLTVEKGEWKEAMAVDGKTYYWWVLLSDLIIHELR